MNNGGLPHENRKYKESTISKWKAYQMSLTADLKLSKKKKKSLWTWRQNNRNYSIQRIEREKIF